MDRDWEKIKGLPLGSVRCVSESSESYPLVSGSTSQGKVCRVGERWILSLPTYYFGWDGSQLTDWLFLLTSCWNRNLQLRHFSTTFMWTDGGMLDLREAFSLNENVSRSSLHISSQFRKITESVCGPASGRVKDQGGEAVLVGRWTTFNRKKSICCQQQKYTP